MIITNQENRPLRKDLDPNKYTLTINGTPFHNFTSKEDAMNFGYQYADTLRDNEKNVDRNILSNILRKFMEQKLNHYNENYF
jgi:hypothetical protein